MSIISHIHTAVIYDAKHTKAYDGQRLVVTIAKKDKDGNYGPHLQQTMATSIPTLTSSDIDFTNLTVQNLCVGWFHKVQNDLISERIKGGVKEVTTDELGQDAIVCYLMSEAQGDKWDESRVAQWFTDNLAIPMTEKLMEQGIEDSQIEVKLGVTGKRFAESLSSKAKIPTQVAAALTRVLNLMDGENDPVYKRFYAKLNPPTVIEALDIGF